MAPVAPSEFRADEPMYVYSPYAQVLGAMCTFDVSGRTIFHVPISAECVQHFDGDSGEDRRLAVATRVANEHGPTPRVAADPSPSFAPFCIPLESEVVSCIIALSPGLEHLGATTPSTMASPTSISSASPLMGPVPVAADAIPPYELPHFDLKGAEAQWNMAAIVEAVAAGFGASAAPGADGVRVQLKKGQQLGLEDNMSTVKMSTAKDDTRADVQKLLDEKGFQDCYDFLYLPMNFQTSKNFGFATVNFADPAMAQRARAALAGLPLQDGASVTFQGFYCQGKASLIDKYSKMKDMKEGNDDFKPIIKRDGQWEVMQYVPPAPEMSGESFVKAPGRRERARMARQWPVRGSALQ